MALAGDVTSLHPAYAPGNLNERLRDLDEAPSAPAAPECERTSFGGVRTLKSSAFHAHCYVNNRTSR